MRIWFWLKCARVYSLPVTIMSWLVVFVWGLRSGGDGVLGLIALVGISCAHLATNLLDDYLDYKILVKDEEYMSAAQVCKCAYLRDGSATPQALLKVIALFCAAAAVTGVVLTVLAGWLVPALALAGALVVLTYQRFSLVGLGEAAVFIAYGPLMFEGVYYVMTGGFSLDVLILSLAVVMIAEGLIYTHMLLDFDGDKVSHKKTLCCRIGDWNNALKLLYVFYILGFASISVLAVKTQNYSLFASFLTMPPAIKLCLDMKIYGQNMSNPLYREETFQPRFNQARDLITYFSLILILVILFR